MTQPHLDTPMPELLKRANLRPTRQRLALMHLLFAGPHRHLTAEQLHAEAVRARVSVSLATIYNTLHHLTNADLLHEVVVEPGRSYFDTNTEDHHHFFHAGRGELRDIKRDSVEVARLPVAPDGARITRVDVIIRLADDV